MSEAIVCRSCGARLPKRGQELLCLACGTWFPGQGRRPAPAPAPGRGSEAPGAADPRASAPMTQAGALGALEEDDLTGSAHLLHTPDPEARVIGPGAPVLHASAPMPPEEDPSGVAASASAWELLEYDSSAAVGTLATPDPDAIARGGPAWRSPEPETGLAPPQGVPAERSASFQAVDFLQAPAPESPRAAGAEKADAGEAEEDEFEEVAGTPWLNVLLLSYASAVTIACIWLWMHRGPAQRPSEDVVPVDTRPDPGHRADRTVKVEPAPPLADDRLTSLGQPLRVGALEVTPLDVRTGKVTLVVPRFDGRPEDRDGGDNALHLRVRFRNISDDLVFAPLDEAFVRERDRELPDSFIETKDGERIYTYALPVDSERAIAGQEFQELKPGEAVETVVVSDTDAADRVQGSSTWRLRLRTGDQKVDVVGVRFEADQIK